ncbi:MAG TPA: DUF1302 family protein [Candidatus Binatia bacterium]|nr:DUF1302 family protein [Candidatus Binatia bacterium]
MNIRETSLSRKIVCGRALLLGIVGALLSGTAAWASTRLGSDIEIQAWYRMRNTFQTDGKEHFDWVQWRNEAFVWLTYDNMVQNGRLKLGEIPVPFVESAALSARFRARVDPVYYLRGHYRHIYDANHRSDFFAPEKEFRDLYLDLTHGQVGPGQLSSRIGYQQIVWGESDLYRSLDIINPLRIDQNFPIGEKFDEFRLPILAVKFLYNLGNVGPLSEVAFEPWYTPRFRSAATHLLDEGIFRIQFQERGCLGPGGQLLDYSPENCAHASKFLPYRPFWLGNRRIENPWSLTRAGNNSRINSIDYVCLTQRCAPDVPGDRASLVVNLPKGHMHHHSRGTDPGQWSAGGIRMLAKTGLGVDLSLDYLFLPNIFADTNPSAPALTYGDGVPGAAGTFQEGLLRCLSPSGKQHVAANGRTNGHTLIILSGADLGGYDWPQRRLDAQGNPLPTAKQKQAARPPLTFCTNGFNHKYLWSHIIGFTATYNDFDYTGAVFRLEESISTKEGLNKRAVGYGQAFPFLANPPEGYIRRHGHILVTTPVWRSMIGFDLAQSLSSYRGLGWTRKLPGEMGTQQSFLSFQWLMQYNFEGLSNNMCNWNFAEGIGPSAPTDGPPVRPAIPGCRTNHWNHFLTLGFSGQGYFHSKLEQRLAVAFEPRGQQWLLYGQWWWRNIWNLPVDLSVGTSWFPSSRMDNSWTLLNYFTNRNLLWFEGTYYLL